MASSWRRERSRVSDDGGVAVFGFGVVVGFGVVFGAGGVEMVFVAAAGEGAVGGFAVEVFVAEDVAVVAGLALGFVDGHRVGVIEAAFVEILRPGSFWWSSSSNLTVTDRRLRVDVGDGAALAVEDAEPVVVGEGHDPVTDRERAAVDLELVGSDEPVGLERRAGVLVEVVDVVVAGGEHERAVPFETSCRAMRRPSRCGRRRWCRGRGRGRARRGSRALG